MVEQRTLLHALWAVSLHASPPVMTEWLGCQGLTRWHALLHSNYAAMQMVTVHQPLLLYGAALGP